MSLDKIIYYYSLSAMGLGIVTIISNFIPYGVFFCTTGAIIFAVLLALDKTPEISKKKTLLFISLAISVFGIVISF